MFLALLTSSGSSMKPVQNSRSEEHTSELQSRLHLVCRLLLEKKKEMNLVVQLPCYQRIHNSDAAEVIRAVFYLVLAYHRRSRVAVEAPAACMSSLPPLIRCVH